MTLQRKLSSASALLALLLLTPVLPAQSKYGPHPFGMEESVDIHTALRSYTAWGSRQMFLENKIGTLEVGKRADIAVWDRDLYAVPADQIKDLKCLMTLLDGEVVYVAPGSPVTASAR
jgi:predicted amidohydrolase YtcJ